jgi:hypothetical protein
MQSDESIALLRMLPQRIAQWAPEIAVASEEHRVDPLLLAAIIERESAGGETLSPPGPGGTGDSGHGRGLCQIDDRANCAWILSADWRNPAINIEHGAMMLRQNMLGLGGSVPAALAGYNAGPSRARHVLTAMVGAPADELVAELDRITTRNYVSGTLAIWTSFRHLAGLE